METVRTSDSSVVPAEKAAEKAAEMGAEMGAIAAALTPYESDGYLREAVEGLRLLLEARSHRGGTFPQEGQYDGGEEGGRGGDLKGRIARDKAENQTSKLLEYV